MGRASVGRAIMWAERAWAACVQTRMIACRGFAVQRHALPFKNALESVSASENSHKSYKL